VWHQAHPVRVAVDALAAAVAVVLFWRHHLVLGVLVAVVPSVGVSAYLLLAAKADDYSRWATTRFFASSLGTPFMLLRLAGIVAAAIGGWYHAWWAVAIGVVAYASSWLRGVAGRAAS
jgi:hypothetical protein